MPTINANPSSESDRTLPQMQVRICTPGEFLQALRTLRATAYALRAPRSQGASPIDFAEPNPRNL